MTAPREVRRRFRLEIESLGEDVPSGRRLARALKCLLRSFGFRATLAIELPAKGAGGNPQPEEVGQ